MDEGYLRKFPIQPTKEYGEAYIGKVHVGVNDFVTIY